MTVAALECRGVGHTYPGDVHALTDVSLSLAPGEVAALVGPSGSGKTTLLRLAGALARPTAGRVVVAGEDPAGLSMRGRARLRLRTVGFVFQTLNLLPALTLRENVELPMLLARWPARDVRARVAELASALGIEGLLGRLPGAVSTGELQRAAVARALAVRPKLLLADEPTSALDTAHATALVDLLHDAAVRGDTAVLMATHDTRVVRPGTRRIGLEDGRLSVGPAAP